MRWVLLPVAFVLGLGVAGLAVHARVEHKTVTLPARTTTLPIRTVTRRVTRIRTRTVILTRTVTPPSSSGIPQGNGGDHDSDNNGGPDDGDGNI
jgi:hypothetical protein